MSFMISRGRVDGNQVGLIVSFGPRNRFTKNGTIFERIRCVRAWSSIGSNGRIARDFSMMKSEIEGRLTCLLPLTRPPACPSMSLGARRLHSVKRRVKKHWRLAQTPYKFWRQLLFAAGVYRNDITNQIAQMRFGVCCGELLATHKHDFHHLLSQM